MDSPPTTQFARPQFRLRSLFILITVVALLLGLVTAGVKMIDRFHAAELAYRLKGTGPIRSPDRWPYPLKQTAERASDLDLEIQDVRVHCLCQGFDQEYIWRMKYDPALWQLLKALWQLSPTAPPNESIFTGKSGYSGLAAPAWWTPKKHDENEFYVREFEQGRIRVAIDPKDEAIYVWSHDSF